jgi:hypothetical protein
MTSVAATEARLRGATSYVTGATTRLARVRPAYVLGVLVIAQWLAILALALKVRHNGWLFYQGGDQVWFYTGSWLQLHGELPVTAVGYGLSTLLMPIALAGGIGARIAGRIFGYWVAFLWIVVPFIGIKYADAGFHQRYTELTLPQGLGLTSMSDFPSMAMLVIGAYFLLRAMQCPTWTDGAFAGLFTGFAIGIKPASSLFLVGVALALLATRRWRLATAFVAGIAPCLLTLMVWKWRGLGYLPLFHAEQGIRIAAGSAFTPPLAGFNLGKYVHLNWSHFGDNLASLQEHFWSKRVIEWLVIAGIVALVRRSLALCLFIGGWFLAFTIVKGTSPLGNLEDATLLRMLLPAAPAFVLILAALPFLLPGVPQRVTAPRPPLPWATQRLRATLFLAALAVFAVVPAAVAGASKPQGPSSPSVFPEQAGPVPIDGGFSIGAVPVRGGARLYWRNQRVGVARIFYQVFRQTAGQGPSQVGSTKDSFFVDKAPPGTYTYWIAVAANWRDDPLGGDGYIVGRPATVTVR